MKYSNIWPNQTIVSDQSELTILLCQPMNSLLLMKTTLSWYSGLQLLPSYIWSLRTTNNTIHCNPTNDTHQQKIKHLWHTICKLLHSSLSFKDSLKSGNSSTWLRAVMTDGAGFFKNHFNGWISSTDLLYMCLAWILMNK